MTQFEIKDKSICCLCKSIKMLSEHRLNPIRPSVESLGGAQCAHHGLPSTTGEGKDDMKEEVKMQETAPGWGESDEGWGVEQSELQGDASANQEDLLALETEISQLREKIRSVEAEKAKMQEELNAAKLKNGKMLVKVKTLTKEVETLKKKKMGSFGKKESLMLKATLLLKVIKFQSL